MSLGELKFAYAPGVCSHPDEPTSNMGEGMLTTAGGSDSKQRSPFDKAMHQEPMIPKVCSQSEDALA